MNKKQSFFFAAAILSLAPCLAWGQLPGTTAVTTGGPSVVPTLETANPGTFLAETSFSAAYFDLSNFKVGSGVLMEALFRNSNGGVDFYFQLQTPFPGQGSTDPIFQVLAANFGSYATSVGYRPDGSTFAADGATGFKDGTIAPTTAERGPDVFNNNSVFFDLPGVSGVSITDVLVVSTNASSFRTIGDLGFSSTSQGYDYQSAINFYSPDGATVVTPVPDGGMTALLLAMSGLGIFGIERMIRRTFRQGQVIG